MSVFKNVKIELAIFLLILFNIIISYKLDISLYNFFLNINYGDGRVYLKEFFINITEIGDSFWFFSICLIFPIIIYLNKKIGFLILKQTDKLKNFFISSFIYILTTGLVTQIIKHVIGRPRPNHADFESKVDLNFFTLESSYHSFPSGHSSTIFIVCLILGATFLKLKYFFYLFAFIVAISRVVVGAHFITDVIAGGLIALIIFKSLNIIMDKKYKSFSFLEYVL